MTPKEKARELVVKYLDLAIEFPYIDKQDGNCIGNGYMTYNSAKQCALAAVDETIEAVKYLDDESESFWKEVEEEIEKL